MVGLSLFACLGEGGVGRLDFFFFNWGFFGLFFPFFPLFLVGWGFCFCIFVVVDFFFFCSNSNLI